MERDLVREDLAHSSPIWVIKVGTSVLAAPDGRLDEQRIANLSDQIAEVVQSGKRVALVSSGAVGAGIGRLGLARRPTDLRHLQAAAASGQAHLIRAYDEAFRKHGFSAAQLLLTRSDFDDRVRYLNVRNTLLTLFEYGSIPIINENDTVSVDEIRFGDNDFLAALVTNLLSAPLLVILSVVDGLLHFDPSRAESLTSAIENAPIRVIHDLNEAIEQHVGPGRSQLGSGGMRSKLEAARLVARAGGSVIITSGLRSDAIRQVLNGRPIGTLIPASGATQQARRRWIGLTARPRGYVIVDDGARLALESGRGSLLAIGIVELEGQFRKGDVVGIRDLRGHEFARGLTNYALEETRAIRGLRTDQIQELQGRTDYEEVIHRDNLVVLG